jgi:hypothetical protein
MIRLANVCTRWDRPPQTLFRAGYHLIGHLGLKPQAETFRLFEASDLALYFEQQGSYRLLRQRMHGLVVLVVRTIVIVVIVVIFSPRRTNRILTSEFFLNPASGSKEWSLDPIDNVATEVPGSVGNGARLLTRLTGLTGIFRVILLLLLLLLRVARRRLPLRYGLCHGRRFFVLGMLSRRL